MPCRHLFSTLAAAGVLAACGTTTTPQVARPDTQRAAIGVGGPGAFMHAYDTNGDGVVTRAEYDAVRLQQFHATDANGDGWLSEQEYVGEFEARLKQQYADQGKAPDEQYAAQMKQAGVRFAVVDRDRDGRYTVDEMRAVAARSFNNADTNGDGVVDHNDPPRQRPARDNQD